MDEVIRRTVESLYDDDDSFKSLLDASTVALQEVSKSRRTGLEDVSFN